MVMACRSFSGFDFESLLEYEKTICDMGAAFGHCSLCDKSEGVFGFLRTQSERTSYITVDETRIHHNTLETQHQS